MDPFKKAAYKERAMELQRYYREEAYQKRLKKILEGPMAERYPPDKSCTAVPSAVGPYDRPRRNLNRRKFFPQTWTSAGDSLNLGVRHFH